MASVSQATLIGNLGRDPETRYTQNGNMNVSFSVATNRRFTDSSGQQQDRTTWFRVTAWGQLAEIMNRFAEEGVLVKGQSVYVSGRLEAREYTDSNGVNRTSLDVTANEIQIVGRRGQEGEGGFGGGTRQPVETGGDRSETFNGDDIDEVPF